jgi:mono/diheme cytochrome c family protein
MISKIGLVACSFSLALSVACGGGETPPAQSPTANAATAPSPAASTFEDQAAEGQKLYAANCAGCHGGSGEGGKGPRVVGVSQGALPLDPPSSAKARKGQFRTAADIAGFVVQSMPPGQAGKLTEAQYFAILAFDLKANGVKLDKRLDGSSAASVVVHP